MWSEYKSPGVQAHGKREKPSFNHSNNAQDIQPREDLWGKYEIFKTTSSTYQFETQFKVPSVN